MNTNTKKVYIETLGCQMNKSDSEKILGILKSIGYEHVENEKEANLLLINTCTIRGSAEDKAFSYLGVWGKRKRSKPNIIIGICGCVAQQKKEKIFQSAPYIDLIFGTHNIQELPFLLNKVETEKTRQCSIIDKAYSGDVIDSIPIRESNITAWIDIIEGCDYFCTYCVVPYVRGRQRSKPFNKVLEEANYLAKEGYKEIILLGQTVDSYGNDLDNKEHNLSNLLRKLNKIEGIERIRFVTSHPEDITDELIDTVAELDKVCEYFHIPMQSGNTDVLKKMKRIYTAEEYYNLVKKIRSKVKDVGITSDFIVAFPGETEEQFMDTIKTINELVFDQCNTAMYSPRKQTPAATWKDIQLSKTVKKERINTINQHVKEAAYKANLQYLNSTQEILVENHSEKDQTLSGRTRNNKLTHFLGSPDLIGKTVKVNITNASTWSLKGTLIE